MWTAIITICAAVIPFGIWLWRRRADRMDDPASKNKARYEQVDKDIAGDFGKAGYEVSDGRGTSEHGSADLDDLDRLQRAKGGGDQR